MLRCGFVSKVKGRNPDVVVVVTHCFLHCEALVTKANSPSYCVG